MILALDAGAVCGATLGWGLGAPRLKAFARAPLPAGALEPGSAPGNLRRPEEVHEAIRSVARALGAAGSTASVILPDGVARLVLLQPPAAVDPLEFARYRMAGDLPFTDGDAVTDILHVGGGRVVAAAVCRQVVEEYETAIAAAGLVQERLDLAPLAALSALVREPASASPTADVALGDVAYTVAARTAGSVLAVRNRRRAPGSGEWARLLEEVDRTVALAGGSAARLRVVGPGSADAIRSWRALGRFADPGWVLESGGAPVDPGELAWLGAALA